MNILYTYVHIHDVYYGNQNLLQAGSMSNTTL